MDGKLIKAIEALKKIAEYDVDQEHGFRDEWNEAASFSICQQIAEDALKELE